MSTSQFVKDIEQAINCHSQENASNTPDFILAKYLGACLAAWNAATQEREKWYGRVPELVPADDAPKDAP